MGSQEPREERKLEKWEWVNSGHPFVQRLKVPGGWLYTAESKEGIVFVPCPSIT